MPCIGWLPAVYAWSGSQRSSQRLRRRHSTQPAAPYADQDMRLLPGAKCGGVVWKFQGFACRGKVLSSGSAQGRGWRALGVAWHRLADGALQARHKPAVAVEQAGLGPGLVHCAQQGVGFSVGSGRLHCGLCLMVCDLPAGAPARRSSGCHVGRAQPGIAAACQRTHSMATCRLPHTCNLMLMGAQAARAGGRAT